MDTQVAVSEHFYCFIVSYLYKTATKLGFDQAISGLYPSAETQFSQEKRRRKFSRTAERAPGMLLLKNRSTTYSNVCPWLKNKTNLVANKRPVSIALLPWSSYTKKFTRKSQLFAVHVWLVQERFLREEFSSKMGPTKSKKSYSRALSRAKLVSGAQTPATQATPRVSKSTHTRKFCNHVTVHRPVAVRPHHRYTNVYSHAFLLLWDPTEPRRKLIAHQCCNQLTAVKTRYPLTSLAVEREL